MVMDNFDKKNSQNAFVHPVNLDGLEKGQYIRPEEIEEIYGKSRVDQNFGLCILQLKQFIERGSDLICRSEKQGLRILDDEQASDYLWALQARHVYGLRKIVMKGNQIDPSEFSDERKKIHEHRLACSAAVYAEAAGTLRREMKERELFGPVPRKMLSEGKGE
jgi:hypothetical protein